MINLKNKKVILVDCFDTLIYRCVSTTQVQLQWANMLKVKFSELNGFSAEQILKARNDIKFGLKDYYDEVPYDVLMEKVCEHFKLKLNKTEFVSYSKSLEENIELGVQFVNGKMLNFLKNQKEKGKKICLVTDFYLPESSIKKFLDYHNISHLFYGIFVSAEINKTKRRHGAKLFLHALSQIGCDLSDAVMIGDNFDVDYKMCKQLGIDSIHYKRKNNKIFNPQKLSNLSFNKKLVCFKLGLWKQKPFMFYSIMFFMFTKYLFEKAKCDGVKLLTFLSRDGYFLKIMFDEFNKLVVPNNHIIKSAYCFNSRKVNESLRNHKISNEYVTYLKSFLDKGYLNMVDCGWNNSTQETISETLNLKTRGYYVGTFSKNKLDYPCDRTGLIYDISENGKTTPYYWLLRTNFTVVEQLLGAPAGSLVAYDKKPEFVWQEQEKQFYFKHVEPLQKQILQEVLSLLVWLKDVPKTEELRLFAKLNVKQGLLSNKKTLNLLNEFSNSYYDNFSSNTNKQGNVNFKNQKQSLHDRLFNPEKRLSITVKKQRKIKNAFSMVLYKIWANCFILKLNLLGKFKKCKEKDDGRVCSEKWRWTMFKRIFKYATFFHKRNNEQIFNTAKL